MTNRYLDCNGKETSTPNRLILVWKNSKLFATDKKGSFQGRVTNTNNGGYLKDNPDELDSSNFDCFFGGHGCVLELRENPPNGFYVGSWKEVIENPELLPTGTKSIFLDTDFNCKGDWKEAIALEQNAS